MNFVPLPSKLFAVIWALFISTRDFTIERPNPVPCPASFVVKYGSNILLIKCGGIPLPLSSTMIWARSGLSPIFCRVFAMRREIVNEGPVLRLGASRALILNSTRFVHMTSSAYTNYGLAALFQGREIFSGMSLLIIFGLSERSWRSIHRSNDFYSRKPQLLVRQVFDSVFFYPRTSSNIPESSEASNFRSQIPLLM